MAQQRRKAKKRFVKKQKTSSYFSRFQVRFKRRRQGLTDYHCRQKLIQQDKRKYNLKKYRVIVRITNKDIICQFAYATIQGDIVLASAYAHELPHFGVKLGLTNYAAAYATGLLLARRALKHFGKEGDWEGQMEIDGEYFCVNGPKAVKAVLDVGLARTTTGARIFGVLKGAVDGGLEINHSESRFPGYSAESSSLDGKVHRSHIFGEHVADYMRQLLEEDEEAYKRQFARYIKAGITADDIEGIYKEAHRLIRENPEVPKKQPSANIVKKRWNAAKQTRAEYQQKIADRKAKALEQMDVTA